MLTVNFSPFPTLRTERLEIRKLVKGDEEDLFAIRSNKTLMRFIPRPLAQSAQDAALLIQGFSDAIRANESITWGIALRSEPRVIGTIGFVRIFKEHYRAEVGYLLHPDFHGTGMMREALLALVDYGFQGLKLHSIEAVVDPENTASAKLLERSGFTKEGHFKENKYFNGRFMDSVYYTRWQPRK
ncbi:GNAT family N-acetyltransferase [Larkinella knui]|uniref:N-acetyltransferase n=1 Tax=Larkinella knui TaxID=2025310 RepID=A0A3P1CVK3_9BACT|nr:GNAT family N-acetyltransferase [Larkinella knui]RRB17345.1 N-acetyltransferase [Larkinella knui]